MAQPGTFDNNNTAIGNASLNAIIVDHAAPPNVNGAGANNTAVGFRAAENSTGNETTAVGANALEDNATGENTAVGAHAARHISGLNGSGNTAIGNWALRYCGCACRNTGVGDRALANDAVPGGNGDYNVALGADALRANHDGDNNVAVGGHAADGVVDGKNSTYLGYRTSAGGPLPIPPVNRTAVGAMASVDQDNAMVLGNTKINVGIGTPTPMATLDIDSVGSSVGPGSSLDQASLRVWGGQVVKVTETDKDYAIKVTDFLIVVDAENAVTVTLPDCSDSQLVADGQMFIIKNISIANSVKISTLSPAGQLDLLDGHASEVVSDGIDFTGESSTVVCAGRAWHVVSRLSRLPLP